MAVHSRAVYIYIYMYIYELPELRIPYGGPYNKDYDILGSILGSPILGKLPSIYIYICTYASFHITITSSIQLFLGGGTTRHMSSFFWWLNLVRLSPLYKILYPKRKI